MIENIVDGLKPRTFHIIRQADESGVSGTGKVLDGILWANGQVSIQWRTDLDPMKVGMSSITIFNSFSAFESIHIDSHPTNETIIVWDDDLYDETAEELKKTKERLKETRKELRELKAELKTEE